MNSKIDTRLRILLLTILWIFIPFVLYAETAQEGSSLVAGFLIPEHINVLMTLLVFSAFFIYFIIVSRKGRSLYLRKIPGVAAIEEAVGRATEMGRPVLYVPGIEKIDEIQTIASVAILSHVARIVAEYDASIIVPTRDSVVMSICEETVKGSYIEAGRPDAFIPDNIRYLSDEQFAFTAGVDGIMMRERPAANIYLGAFFAESLILAETGFSSGAIQVAGTASIPQLPFFITACDFTIIAEEFYAVSAYLSRDPKILSGVKASDYFKIVVLVLLLIGILLASLESDWLGVLKFWF